MTGYIRNTDAEIRVDYRVKYSECPDSVEAFDLIAKKDPFITYIGLVYFKGELKDNYVVYYHGFQKIGATE